MKNTIAQISAHNWFEFFTRAYVAELGYVFLLSGNISDLFPLEKDFCTLRQFWARKLVSAPFEIVVFWDKSSGFVFGDEIVGIKNEISMRERFKVSVGMNSSASNNSSASLLSGLAGITGGNELPTDPEQAFVLLERLLSKGKPEEHKAAVVIEYVESVIPETDYTSVQAVTLQRWASLDSTLKGTGNPVILIERNSERVSSVVKNDDSSVVSIHIPRPTRDEFENFITHSLKELGVKILDDLSVGILANLCAGLRCKDFEDFCMRSLESGEPISDQFIWSKKVQIIEKQSGGVLKVVKPKHGFESIGGLEYVKDALSIQIKKLRCGSKTTDKGWILMGPPGTGKTIIAEALAKESGVNFLILGNVLSKYVGDSERNMNLAMDIARAMAPTIIFVDEAAEAIGNGDGYNGDSGTSSRVRGTLQNIMGDDSTRGKLFFMLATNYPNRLAPAILREGRMDKRVPLLVPDRAGREAILQALCVKYEIEGEKIDFGFTLDSTDTWTGAELEALILRARQFSESEEGVAEVTTADMKKAVEDYIHSRDEDAFNLMTALAIRYTNSKSLLPAQYAEQVKGIDKKIDDLEPRVVERESRRRGNKPF